MRSVQAMAHDQRRPGLTAEEVAHALEDRIARSSCVRAHGWAHGLVARSCGYKTMYSVFVRFEPRVWIDSQDTGRPAAAAFVANILGSCYWSSVDPRFQQRAQDLDTRSLTKKGHPHPEQCVVLLCDQEEMVQHILPCCIFARQLLHNWLPPIGLERIMPRRNGKRFAERWKAIQNIAKAKRKGFNGTVILGAQALCNHRNSCAFYGASLFPDAQFFKEELQLWCFVAVSFVR